MRANPGAMIRMRRGEKRIPRIVRQSNITPATVKAMFPEHVRAAGADIVLGKFLACTVFLAALLAPTLAYPLLVGALGDLDIGPVIGGYLGALLLGAAFAAVGLFASALTRSQIVAFLTGCAICFALCLVDQMAFFLPEAAARPLAHLAADLHFENIARGLVDTRDVLYFASLGFVALSATALVLHEKHA